MVCSCALPFDSDFASTHSLLMRKIFPLRKWQLIFQLSDRMFIDATDGKTSSIPRLLFNSNRAAVIRNQILIRTMIGASIFNKMNAFLKLTSGFKFRIINSLKFHVNARKPRASTGTGREGRD